MDVKVCFTIADSGAIEAEMYRHDGLGDDAVTIKTASGTSVAEALHNLASMLQLPLVNASAPTPGTRSIFQDQIGQQKGTV